MTQREMLQVLAGGRRGAPDFSDDNAPQIRPSATENTHSIATEIQSIINENPDPAATEMPSRAAQGTTITTTKKSESLDCCGDENGTAQTHIETEIPGKPGPAVSAETEPPPCSTDIDPQRTRLLAERVAAACGYRASLNQTDLDVVHRWLEKGATEDLVMRAVDEERSKPKPRAVVSLRFFNWRIGFELDKQKEAARQGPVRIAMPEDPQLHALAIRMREATARWYKDTSGPMTPGIDLLRQEPLLPLIRRWLAVHEAWSKTPRRGAIKPPSFIDPLLNRVSFLERLADCEEAIADAAGVASPDTS
jgi:hypothetical protein